MKKIILILLPFILWGCQKKFNDVVDPGTVSNAEVKTVETANSFTYSPFDSVLTVSIALTSGNDVKEVYCDIYSPDGTLLTDNPLQLFDNGDITVNGDTAKADNQFSNKFPLSGSFVTGNIKIQFYVKNDAGNSRLMAVHYVKFSPGVPNEAPVISDLVAPDSAVIGTPDSLIVITLKVQDANGLKDISSVYFNSYIPPDGNLAHNNPTYLTDDGQNGDKTAGDGIYTVTVVLPYNAPKGQFRWEFFAKDRSGALSNKITHYLIVK